MSKKSKKNKSSTVADWKREGRFNRYGNISIVADDLLHGVREVFQDDTIPMAEKFKRLEVAQEATDLILDHWCSGFPSKEYKENVRSTCHILLGMAGLDAMFTQMGKGVKS